MKTLFVTGADGFTGKHLVQYLRRRGYEVVGGVRNRARKLVMERESVKALVCDVSDAINVARAIASVAPDGIIHLAGLSQPQNVDGDPLPAYQSIVTAWANVLDGARRACPRARVLLASSYEVYGLAGDDGHALAETTPVSACTTFGALKATAEAIARTFFDNYHLNLTVVRPFDYAGPGTSEFSFFGGMVRRILASENPGAPVAIPHLNASRDLAHVNDVLEAYSILLEEGKPGETYNICSGKTCSVNDMAQAISRAAGKTQTFVEAPGSAPAAPSPKCLLGDATRLCEFGWQPTHTLAQIAGDTLRAFAPSLTSTRT